MASLSTKLRVSDRPGQPAELAFGVFFFDYDLDGHPDILAANGHIERTSAGSSREISSKSLPCFSRITGKGRFINAQVQPAPISSGRWWHEALLTPTTTATVIST